MWNKKFLFLWSGSWKKAMSRRDGNNHTTIIKKKVWILSVPPSFSSLRGYETKGHTTINTDALQSEVEGLVIETLVALCLISENKYIGRGVYLAIVITDFCLSSFFPLIAFHPLQGFQGSWFFMEEYVKRYIICVLFKFLFDERWFSSIFLFFRPVFGHWSLDQPSSLAYFGLILFLTI